MSYQYKNFSDLDFEQIKQSFKDFLNTQDDFKDYNFEGAAMNALINVLAYNTQYNAYYLNMMSSERFIATAQRRENVVALAKNLGYRPYSSRGAVALLRLEVEAEENFREDELKIPRHTMFSASTENDSYIFYTEEVYPLKRDYVTKKFYGNVNVFEGKKFTHTFTIKSEEKGVVLPNKNVQTNRLKVTVRSGSIAQEFFQIDDISAVDGTSPIYFVEEVIGQKTRIYFGDGVLGKSLLDGDEVTVEYFTSKGKEANTATRFTFSDAVPNATTVTVLNQKDTVIDPNTNIAIYAAKAADGADIETIESIRSNAPMYFEAQNRAVTAQDFKVILTSKLLDDVHTISCWGGEDETPQKLGYVFLSWVTNAEISNETDNTVIFRTPEQKEYIEKELREKYSTVTIFPQVVDPQSIYISITTKAVYDSTKSITKDALVQTIKDAVRKDYKDNYSKFQSTLRYSRLSTAIDTASPVIKSNDLKISFYQEEGSVQSMSQKGVMIGIPVAVWSLRSSLFTYRVGGVTRRQAFLSDGLQPGNEVALFYQDANQTNQLWVQNVATIDRHTGKLTFNSIFSFDSMSGVDEYNRFRVYASGSNRDTDFTKNLIPIMRLSDINVEIRAD